jgi:hypothetical protein
VDAKKSKKVSPKKGTTETKVPSPKGGTACEAQ